MKLRLANLNEAEICYQCIEDARAYHKSLGFEQWHPDYPTEQTILDDIAQNIGYVFVKDNEIIGYCCIIPDDRDRGSIILRSCQAFITYLASTNL